VKTIELLAAAGAKFDPERLLKGAEGNVKVQEAIRRLATR